MSEQMLWFRSPAGTLGLRLPFGLQAVLGGWSSLRSAMARHKPDAFARDEWAYLMSFVEGQHLRDVFTQSLGEAHDSGAGATRILRPIGSVAVWLPNNVSLLGPLTMILLSITGNRVMLKGGSRSADLTGAFLAFVREHLRDGELRSLLESHVRYEVFDRRDARNAEYAACAQARIVFGSDAAAEAIDALAHPRNSVGFDFIDRRSEAWVEREQMNDDTLDALIKVFAIYGQAGCTSPRRVVVLDGAPSDAVELRDRMLARWPQVIRRAAAPHVASANLMARQWAATLGWDARLVPGNGAMLATGSAELEAFDAPMGLPIVAASRAAAVQTLPANIQTVGQAIGGADTPAWLACIAATRIKRFVPLARMHHFGPVWDGVSFWRRTFEDVEVGA